MLENAAFVLVFTTVTALLAAGIFIAVTLRYFEQPKRTARALLKEAEEEIVFLFDDQTLIDASKPAKSMLRNAKGDMTDWDRFLAFFAPYFPQLRRHLSTLATDGSKELISPDHPEIRLIAEYWQGLARIAYVENGADAKNSIERAKRLSTDDELETLRGLAEDAPLLMWKEDDSRTITWVNKAYLTAAQNIDADRQNKWPPSKLFDEIPFAENGAPHTSRQTIEHDEQTKHFDVTSLLRGSEILHFAVDVTAVARAEETQRSYVNTLVKTFAQLSTGLAVFDVNRQLIVFNPALMDLTGLPVDFLSNRPVIHDFLDRLHDHRMTPEPKNFGGWREHIAELETAASTGTYCERWDLPTGQTFRVTGRPHPNGAVALLFEDISDEMTATRRYRHVIDTNQAALDSVDDAIAVFSQAGTLILSNRAYSAMWHAQPINTFVGSSYLEESRIWQKTTAPTPLWIKIHEQISDSDNKTSWKSEARLADGRTIGCHVSSLPNNATMIRFCAIHDQNWSLHPPENRVVALS